VSRDGFLNFVVTIETDADKEIAVRSVVNHEHPIRITHESSVIITDINHVVLVVSVVTADDVFDVPPGFFDPFGVDLNVNHCL